MKKHIIAAAIALAVALPAHAINAHYRDQLIRSGCTQSSVSEGCDINRSKEWNARHGHSAHQERHEMHQAANEGIAAFAGDYTAQHDGGQRVANIVVVPMDTIQLNGHSARGKVEHGKLVIRDNGVVYTINNKHGGHWVDRDAGNQGRIVSGMR